MRWSALLFLVLFGGQPTIPVRTSVFGYVQDGRFHPLLVVEAAQFGPFDPRTTSLSGGVLRSAFDASGSEFPVQAERGYLDDRGEPAKYGLAPGRSYENLFFELNRAKPRAASAPSSELTRSFLRFLADDDRSGDVRILYVTDLDSDGKQELWVVYRLGKGGIGRMVWEQRAVAGEWIELANHCFGCAD